MQKMHESNMNLKQHYQEKVVPKLMEEFGVKNRLAVPGVKRVVVNIGLKEAANDKGVLDKAGSQLAVITGQKPKETRAKKSIAKFNLSEGDPLGLTEQIVIPENDYSKMDKMRDREVSFVIQSGDAKISKRLVKLLGLRFKK